MSLGVGALTVCPKCHTADAIDLSDGTWLCLGCRNEWNPHDLSEPPVAFDVNTHDIPTEEALTVERVLAAIDPEGVFAPPPDESDGRTTALVLGGDPRIWADWSGEFARLASGVEIVVTDDTGGVMIRGVDATGKQHRGQRAKATLLGTDPPATAGALPPVDGDEPIPQIVLATAGLCLTVALDAVSTDADGMSVVGNPRIGWLPPPCDQVPEAECGVAYACALLISIFGLDREQVEKLAANLLTGAEAGVEKETEQ